MAGDKPLTPAQEALLAARLKGRRADPEPTGPSRRAATGPVPLSFGQERLWLLDQMEGGGAGYSVPLARRLLGPLDVGALRRALAEVVRRHEALRTTYREVDGRPMQVVGEAGPVDVPVEDVASEAEARRLVEAEADRPFDLLHGPVVRARLLRLGASDHVFVLNVHHIAIDGWSASLVLSEVATLYDAFLRGDSSPIPRPSLQYADFAAWQRERLGGSRLAAEIAHWRGKLEGLPPLDLPTDRPRPPVVSFRGAQVAFSIPREVAERAEELGRQEGATPFMVLLAAFQALLGRHARQEDVAVGSPVAGRTRRELEGIVGFFVNTLVLRADLSGDPTFRDLVRRVRGTCLEAYDHQDVPFEKLVAELRPARDPGRHPLVQALFTLQTAPPAALDIPSIQVRHFPFRATTTKADVTLSLTRAPEGFLGVLEYGTDLFEEETARRMAAHYSTLLAGLVASPDAPIGEASLLAPAERDALAAGLHSVRTPFPPHATVHEAFAEQARRAPDRVAVEFGDTRLTYADLDARAETLARRLRARGVGPDAPVGLCVERSADLVVGMLGILKAGGAYVPLDPDYPEERLRFMLEDAGVLVVVAHAATRGALPPGADAVLLEEAEGTAPPAEDPPDAGPESLAYVVYTSGSTGTPKGVAVPHRAILRLVFDQTYVDLGASDAVAQASNASFDAATFEVWAPLLLGARVVGVPKDVLISPEALEATLRERGVTTLFVTTALFNQVARARPGAFAGLRHLLFGGEACDPRSVRRVLEEGRPGRLLHVYGPTETTTFATWHEVADVPEGATTVPIGRPLANTRLHVLDPRMRLVPAGVPGELCIGGGGVARGYWDRPELTRQRFVPDPFTSDPGARLYRTGDLVRWRADGALEFLGRLDNQVKIRGFRIEPGEVEAAVKGFAEVKEAVVVARDDPPTQKRLVAYVVLASRDARVLQRLRDHLARTLPPYMVPSAFVPLDALPLTKNGKIDRAALPAPEIASGQEEHEPPATVTEEILAAVWSEVLGGVRVGRRDDFFALGGHSLLAAQVAARARDALRVELSLRTVLEHPILSDLAREADALRARQDATDAAPAPVRAARREGEDAPLSFAQQRLWFLHQWEPDSPTYNVPLARRLRGPFDADAFARALAEVVRRHEVLRTTFALGEDGPVQVVAPPGPVPLPVEEVPGDDALARRLREEATRPFDLARGPVLRARLFRLGAEDHVLFLNVHHVAFDGWSAAVLLRELATLHAAFARGEPSPLPELPIQYADYAAWQRARLSGERLNREVAHWRARLAGLAPLELPTTHPRRADRRGRGARADVHVPREVAERIAALSRAQGSTPFMALLAAFKLLLSRYASQDDVAVGSPVAGRTHRETEDLIGFFVNTLVLRTDLSGGPTFRELLRRVRETCLDAYAHQEIPFERLVAELHPERDPSRQPLVQVVFALQQFARSDALRSTAVAIDHDVAKFDLTVTMREGPQGLVGTFEYDADVFDEATAARMAKHYRALLEAVAADPDRPAHEISFLSDEERRELLVDFNPPPTPYPRDATVHALFAETAARHPDRVAVEFGDTRLTYAELDARAEALARRLRARGVGPDAPVGLCVERSADLVVGMLGILKAGGAYVPLDPDYPEERLRFMLEDAGVALVLAHAPTAERIPTSTGRAVLRLDKPWVEDDDVAPAPPAVGVEGLAYVMYTSGSTGTPKGVAIPHRGIVRLLKGQSYVEITPDDVVLQYAPASFDAATFEVWGALLNGARLVLMPPGPAALEDLALMLRERRVTVLWLTAPIFRLLVDTDVEALRDVRWLLTGGDVVPPTHAARAAAAMRRGHLVNGYGPTESTTFACTWRFTGLLPPDAPLPIGRPIAHTTAYVLDARMQPAPVGVPGELCLGGDGLARGYWNRPELTRERFVPNTFAPGGRLYRTGDLVRWRADGTLEFLGRLDNQVKIRGFRIEPGEVEAALAACEGVKEAVVVAREDAPGQKRLVAYVVADGEAASVASLRERLARLLPAYMVPAAFVLLDALPLSPNGKVDRRALPAPDLSAPVARVAPRTPAEETLAAIWAAVLRVEEVGVEENFFELGGDSILSIQIVARAREKGLALRPRDLFEHQTIADLARAARPLAASGGPGGEAHAGPVPSTPVQRWFFERDLPDPHHFNQSVLLDVPEGVEAAHLDAALRGLLAAHPALRLRFHREGDGWRQEVAPPGEGALLRVVDLSTEPPASRDAAMAGEAERLQAGLDLARGPITRAVLFELGTARRLLWVAHHLAVDAVSWRILVEDLSTACARLARGDPLHVPPEGMSFPAWAHGLVAAARSDETRAEASFWRERPPADPLPRDDPDGRNDLEAERTIRTVLQEEETRALLHDAPRAWGTQPNDVFLAALSHAARARFGMRRLLVDLEGHGREEDAVPGAELSRTVGWFTTIFPVLLEAGDTDDLRSALDAVRMQLAAVPRRGIGYGLLRYLGDGDEARALRDLPVPEMSFNYLGHFEPSAREPEGIRAVPGPRGRETSGRGTRAHLLDVNGGATGGRLWFDFHFCDAIHAKATVAGLAAAYAEALRGLAALAREDAKASDAHETVPLARWVEARPRAPRGRFFVANATGKRPPLFCVHPGGGTAASYVPLARALSREQPFYGIHPAGLDDGLAPHDRFPEMARFYMEQIRALFPLNGFALAGWSMGATVAFEMARQLAAGGEPPRALVLIDPLWWEPGFERKWMLDARENVRGIRRLLAVVETLSPGTPGRRDAERALATALAGMMHMQRAPDLSGTGPEALERVRRVLDVGEAHANAVLGHERRPYSGDAVLVTCEDTVARHPEVLPEVRRLVEGDLQVHTLPGDHYSILRGGSVARLARIVDGLSRAPSSR